MSTPTCPITGEPLLNPGQTVSKTALLELRTKTNDVAELMRRIDQRLAGAGRPERVVHTRSVPASKPPLSLGLLDVVDEHRDTVEAWAWNIMQHLKPAWRMPRSHDWHLVEAIYQQHLESLSQWEYAPAMVDEVTDAMRHLTRLDEPAPIQADPEDIAGRYLQIGNVCDVIKFYWGIEPNRSTIRTWIERGKLKPTSHEPPRYLVRDVLRLAQGA